MPALFTSTSSFFDLAQTPFRIDSVFRHVRRDSRRATAAAARIAASRFCSSVRAHFENRHARTLGGEAFSDRPPNARACASDERHVLPAKRWGLADMLEVAPASSRPSK